MTKKQILRIIGIALVVIAGILIVVFAVAGSVQASAAAEKKPVISVERGDNKIALTFDCAWDAADTDKLLGMLSDADIRATFFVTGEFCDTHADSVRKMSAGGHSVQNLSDKNIHIKGMNINDLIADTKEAAKKIKTITGKDPALYRAPFGDFDDKALTTLEGMGLIPVQWSVDSRDLDDPDAASVKKRVLDGTASGSVLLFHNDSPVTGEVLPQLITALRQKGFEFVRAEELIFTESFVIDENGIQHYHPTVQTVVPIVYSEKDPALDAAFESLRMNLTLQEIYDLSSVGRVGLVDKIKTFLNESELYAVREATYEELMDCYTVLVYAAENYGCGGTYTDPQYEPVPQIVSLPEDDTGDEIPRDEPLPIPEEQTPKDTVPDSEEAEIVK